MAPCAVDETPPETFREWLFCRFMQYGCDWAGVRYDRWQRDIAREIRDSHERHCRYRRSEVDLT